MAILFIFVTKLQKLVRWFDGINEEKKRITRDALSQGWPTRGSRAACGSLRSFMRIFLKLFVSSSSCLIM